VLGAIHSGRPEKEHLEGVREEVMSVADPIRHGVTQLKQALEGQIVRRVGRRVRQLRVEVGAGRVVVHGRTASYYVKQLAIQAVLEVLDEANQALVADVRVHVELPGQWPGD
jgi:hypothetical protein